MGGGLGGYLQKALFMAFLFSGRFSSTCSTCSCTGVTRRVSKLRRCGSAAPEAIVRVNSQNAAGRGGGGQGMDVGCTKREWGKRGGTGEQRELLGRNFGAS